MKSIKRKIILPIAILIFAIGYTSCVNDLDVTPIDPNLTLTFDQDGFFAKIYASLALSGQEGPSGNGDLGSIDEGTSNFVRLIWNLNELTTDEAICSWGDPGIPEMNFNSWSSSHDQLKGLYGRLYFGVTICNRFLELTKDSTSAKSVKQKAEVRFMRALNYYYLLDLFGNVPFSEVVSLDLPKQIKRADLFNYIESELLAIEPEMYDPKQAPAYRVDKVANWLLLSRLYLNAEVYTGTQRWNDAAKYAKKIIDPSSGYTLCPTYKHLFMADNDGSSSVNKAKDEIIFSIACDGVKTKSWGTSLFLIASTHTNGMNAWGTTEGWGGNRARSTLVNKFFPNGISAAFIKDKTDYTTSQLSSYKDARAMFFGTTDRTLLITNPGIFKEGFSVNKFSNVRADGGASSDAKFTDTDVPLFRAAEAYLTYSEAVLRGANKIDNYEPLTAINKLRARAGAKLFVQADITLDKILDEKAREFYFEGQRRTDLIRHGKYGGANTGYTWEWKGNDINGKDFSADLNLYPIPASDLNANPNLKQNPGY